MDEPARPAPGLFGRVEAGVCRGADHDPDPGAHGNELFVVFIHDIHHELAVTGAGAGATATGAGAE